MLLKADGSLEKLEKQTSTIKDKGGSNSFANAYSFGKTAGSVQYINLTGASSTVTGPNCYLCS